jgi:hypothetical protein
MKLIYEHNEKSSVLTLYVTPEEHAAIAESSPHNDACSIINQAIKQIRLDQTSNFKRWDLHVFLTEPKFSLVK